MTKKKKYIYGLDALRALAILGVSLFHVFPNVVKGGYLGVSLFFVITGFLLAYNSRKNFHILSYYWKRIKRIYPALLIVILSTCGICYFFDNAALSGIKAEILSIIGGYNNWWQIQQNADYFTRSANFSPFTHFWFLGIELQYYLIWPILFFGYRLFSKKFGKQNGILALLGLSLLSVLIMMILYSPDRDVTRIYYGTDTRIHALLLGSTLGLVYSNKKRKVNKQRITLNGMFLLVSLLLTIVAFLLLNGQSAFLYRGGMFAMTLIFVGMVAILSNPSLPYGKMLEGKPIKWIGKYAYSIYLVQYPILFFFTEFKWTFFGYQILECILIVLCAYLLENVLTFYKMRNRILALLLVISTTITMIFGCVGIVNSKDVNKEAMNTLQEEIEENEKAVEEEMKQMQQKAEEKKEEPKEETVEEEPEDEGYDSEYCKLTNVVMIGDSILLRCYDTMHQTFTDCAVNGRVARQVNEGEYMFNEYCKLDYVDKTIVIALGTNGNMGADVCRSLLNRIGDKIDIFWINNYVPTRPWMVPNNELLNRLEEEYPNLHIVDWVGECLEHPEYLDVDSVHPSRDGVIAYCNLLYDTIASTPHLIEKKESVKKKEETKNTKEE